jgi:hypothetical protein
MSMTCVRIVDEAATGESLHEFQVTMPQPKVTIKDIIAARVEAEVEAYNAKVGEHLHGLVQPTEAEAVLNGFKLKKSVRVDVEKQTYVALDAFAKNGYFVFVDDLQAESLDQVVEIEGDTKVSFVKLTPLVGG